MSEKTVVWLVSVAVGSALGIAQTELLFTRCQSSANGELLLTLKAGTGAICRIETSTNLLDWSALVTMASAGMNQYTDSAAVFLPACYYRARLVEGENVLAGDHVQTDNGDILIHPINHASLLLLWKDTVVSIDPVNSTYYKSLPKADLVLVTHDHSDHFDTTAITQSISTNAVIGVPLTVYNKLTTGLRSIAFVLTNGMATNLAGIRVEVIPAYNTNSSPFHARGSGNGYVLGIGNRRIYVSGDTHNIPEMSALQAIDIAFLAMNQPYTMTVTMAVSAVRAFRPRVVYPYHYRAASGYPATDLAGFKQQLLLDPGVEVRLRQWY